MIFNPSAAGKNSLNAEAGLLTYPLPMPSQPISGQWQRFSAVITTQKAWRTYSSEDCPGFSPDSLFIATPKTGRCEPLLMQI